MSFEEIKAKLTPEELKVLKQGFLHEFNTWLATDLNENLPRGWNSKADIACSYLRIQILMGEELPTGKLTEMELKQMKHLRDDYKLSEARIGFILGRSAEAIRLNLMTPIVTSPPQP